MMCIELTVLIIILAVIALFSMFMGIFKLVHKNNITLDADIFTAEEAQQIFDAQVDWGSIDLSKNKILRDAIKKNN